MGKKTASAPLSLAALNVLLRDKSGSYTYTPARLSIDGSQIASVETCSREDYPQRVKAWQQHYPEMVAFDDATVLTPAFINSHTHLSMNMFRGIDLTKSAKKNMVEDWFFAIEKHLSPDDVRAFSRMGAYECLLSGTGFVWDHYYHGESIAQALADTGLSGAVAPTLQDLAGPGEDQWEQQWEATEAINRSVRFRAKGIVAAFGPHATDTVSSELWQKILSACEKLQVPLHAHLAQSLDEWQRSMNRNKCSPTEFLRTTGVLSSSCAKVFAHGIFVGKSDLQALQKTNSTLVFCPFSALIFGFPANIMQWEEAKLPWVVATDCAASNDSMNVQKELRYISGFPLQQLSYDSSYLQFLQEQTKPESVVSLRSKLWSASANFRDPQWLLEKLWELPGHMHPQVKVGRIAPGYLANIVVWKKSNASLWPGEQLRTLAFGDTANSIDALLVAGKWVGQPGNFAQSLVNSQSYLAAEEEARERLQLLRAKVLANK